MKEAAWNAGSDQFRGRKLDETSIDMPGIYTSSSEPGFAASGVSAGMGGTPYVVQYGVHPYGGRLHMQAFLNVGFLVTLSLH